VTVADSGSRASRPQPDVQSEVDLTDDGRPDVQGRSVGELLGEVTGDLSALMHKEVELAKLEARQAVEMAKTELKDEATKAGRGAGLLAGAGVAGHLVLVFLSLMLMFVLENVIGIEWSALIVALVWAVVGAVLFTMGRKALREVRPVPERTIETVKEDLEWQRNQIS
jgi:hypothetical protein